MPIRKYLLYKLATRNKKMGLLYLGYKAAKYGLGIYRKRRRKKKF
ncbi:hypothetical protein HME9304_00244 [Flagellimonas maritima]|uniref:Uncharacterized protein n=1 Tax=Flagellimonas maritima TaxID=1383885 RepID=A0A2Z4LPU1_9FLAO|nr:hypothetical protein HME9304_00244 [Allomuricauda aurantiaca]